MQSQLLPSTLERIWYVTYTETVQQNHLCPLRDDGHFQTSKERACTSIHIYKKVGNIIQQRITGSFLMDPSSPSVSQ